MNSRQENQNLRHNPEKSLRYQEAWKKLFNRAIVLAVGAEAIVIAVGRADELEYQHGPGIAGLAACVYGVAGAIQARRNEAAGFHQPMPEQLLESGQPLADAIVLEFPQPVELPMEPVATVTRIHAG